MFFWMVFLKMHQQMLLIVKNAFLSFLALKNFFFMRFQKCWLIKPVCVCIVFKVKTKEKYEEKNLQVCIAKLKKALMFCFNAHQYQQKLRSFQNNRGTNVFFSVFLKMRRKKAKVAPKHQQQSLYVAEPI